MRSYRILFAAAEVAPYAKVGGLADVAGSLPQALAELGHDVRVALPLYGTIEREKWGIGDRARPLAVPFGARTLAAKVHEARRDGASVVFIENPQFFGRTKVYGEDDDAKRFTFFCRAVCEEALQNDWKPDVVHAHDWHAGLIPQLVKQGFDKTLPATASVFTIHNLAYQGVTKERVLYFAGLGEDHMVLEKKRWGKQINPMARGIGFADVVSTVSERYAKEILTPEFGEGLESLLQEREGDLFGIVNGIDVSVFDPSRDQHIPARYSQEDPSGKAQNKRALQEEFALALEPRTPLLGVVGRLVEQKGVDLLTEVARDLLDGGAQLIVLGTGDPKYEERWRALAAEYKGALGVRIGFDAGLAQRIYAGSDMFLMPSRFEPCGLGQLISLRYGTVPVVRAVGGLADTVRDFDADPRHGNGFSFAAYTRAGFSGALARALRLYRHADRWRELTVRGMREDHSWQASARKYVELYETAVESRIKAEGAA
jgi:starch synthase